MTDKKREVQDPIAREVIARLRAGAPVPPEVVANAIEGFVLELEDRDLELQRIRKRVAEVAAAAEALNPAPFDLSRYMMPSFSVPCTWPKEAKKP
jgi:hypothetical protein